MIGIVDLAGGFGNYLFLYAFGLNLKKQGVNVYIYNPTKKYYLEPSEFGFNKLKGLKFLSLEIYKKLNKKNNNYLLINSEQIINKKFDVKELYVDKKVISFNGFFQDYSFVQENISQIRDAISQSTNNINSDQNNLIPNTMLHVRRGDYLELGEELSINYYKEAISYCKKNIKNFNFNVYTDDYEWTKNQDIFKDANKIENTPNIEKRIENSVLSTFKEMLGYENFIIANSTYSWWAAVLGSDDKSVVTCPSPFYKTHNNNLELNNWVILDRE